MTHDDIIRMAREAGFDAESDTLTRYEGLVKPLTRFATLVVANLDPKSFMSWQEGYESGVVAEREACARIADSQLFNTNALLTAPIQSSAAYQIGVSIRARGQS